MRLMNFPRRRSHLLPFLLLLLLAGSASAQTPNPVLAGLKGVAVQVVLLNDSEYKMGVDRTALYKAVTEALREYKVNYVPLGAEYVSGRKDPFEAMPAGYALLRFKVVALASEDRPGCSAVSIEMNLLEKVKPSRDTSKEIIASVYTGSNSLLVTRAAPEVVTQDVRRQAREFAAAFRASNPVGAAAIRRRKPGAVMDATSMRRR
jgi:hypothetical protein